MFKVKVFDHSASSSVVQGTQRIILPQIFVEFHLECNMLLKKLGLTPGVPSLVSAIISEENQKKARQLLQFKRKNPKVKQDVNVSGYLGEGN